MIWGLSTSAFTLVHVVLSLAGIVAGLVVMFALVAGKRLDGWTAIFLATTLLTSVTGFGFPFDHLLPSHKVGILSLVVLLVAIAARYAFHLAGAWRRVYVIGAAIALYLNIFVLVAQLFLKVPALKALAPTQKEPPFAIAQLVVLVLFGALAVRATIRSRAASAIAAGFLLLSPGFAPAARAEVGDSAIESRSAEADGVRLHYLNAGNGPTVLLLHGYAETSRMWIPLIPVLARKFTVIAPDLPGIGDSAIPLDGLDMKSAAARIHTLVRLLGVQKARVVGHDIGLMVAYAYAAQFPTEVEKLVLMDAFLPGVEGWETIYNNPGIWHFRFNGPTPEKLVQGRERTYFEHFWNDFAADPAHSIPEADRVAYTAAYSRPGRMRAGWAYFVSFQKAAGDFAELSRTKLSMPVLSIGGEKANGEALGKQVKLVATDATVVILKDTGHWVMEERPRETADALLKFL